jgi:hypothetical protein
MFIIVSYSKKPGINKLISVLLFIALPPSMFFINIFSDRVPDALMMQSFTFYYIFPLILHNYLSTHKEKTLFEFKIVSNIFNVILIVVILAQTVQYTYMNAYNYHMLSEENRVADLKYNELITRVESYSGYTTKTPVAFIGYLPFNISASPYAENRTWIRGCYLISEPSVEAWIRPNYFRKVMNYFPRIVDDETVKNITATQEYQNMGIYPNANSIRMINNVLVIRFPGSREEIYQMYYD